jgi:hypothetical protein
MVDLPRAGHAAKPEDAVDAGRRRRLPSPQAHAMTLRSISDRVPARHCMAPSQRLRSTVALSGLWKFFFKQTVFLFFLALVRTVGTST